MQQPTRQTFTSVFIGSNGHLDVEDCLGFWLIFSGTSDLWFQSLSHPKPSKWSQGWRDNKFRILKTCGDDLRLLLDMYMFWAFSSFPHRFQLVKHQPEGKKTTVEIWLWPPRAELFWLPFPQAKCIECCKKTFWGMGGVSIYNCCKTQLCGKVPHVFERTIFHDFTRWDDVDPIWIDSYWMTSAKPTRQWKIDHLKAVLVYWRATCLDMFGFVDSVDSNKNDCRESPQKEPVHVTHVFHRSRNLSLTKQ